MIVDTKRIWPKYAPNFLRRPYCRVFGHVKKPIVVMNIVGYAVQCGICSQILVKVVDK